MLKSRKLNPSPDDEKVLLEFMALTGKRSKNVSIIVATNKPDNIDTALHRRLGNFIEVEKPSEQEIVPLLDIYFSENKQFYPTVDQSLVDQKKTKISIAKTLNRFAPADIKKLVEDSFFDAMENDEKLSNLHFDRSVRSIDNRNNLSKDYLK